MSLSPDKQAEMNMLMFEATEEFIKGSRRGDSRYHRWRCRRSFKMSIAQAGSPPLMAKMLSIFDMIWP